MYVCNCDQRYGNYGRAPESECNMKCRGDGNQICGGGYRNSVYSGEDFYKIITLKSPYNYDLHLNGFCIKKLSFLRIFYFYV